MTNVALLRRKRKAVHGKSLDISQIDLDAFMKPTPQTTHEFDRLLMVAGVVVALALGLLFWLCSLGGGLFTDYTDVERSNQLVELGKDERAMAAESAAFYGM